MTVPHKKHIVIGALVLAMFGGTFSSSQHAQVIACDVRVIDFLPYFFGIRCPGTVYSPATGQFGPNQEPKPPPPVHTAPLPPMPDPPAPPVVVEPVVVVPPPVLPPPTIPVEPPVVIDPSVPVEPPLVTPPDAPRVVGYFVDSTTGVVWYQDGTGNPWRSPLEGTPPRENAVMEEAIRDGILLQFKATEEAAMRTAIFNFTMRGKTFIAEDNTDAHAKTEWHCIHAGQLVKIDVREDSRAITVRKGSTALMSLTQSNTPWRSPFLFPDGQSLPKSPDDVVIFNGIRFSRTTWGVFVWPNDDAVVGTFQVTWMGRTIPITVTDPSAGPVTMTLSQNFVELGSMLGIRLNPPEATVRLAGTDQELRGTVQKIRNDIAELDRSIGFYVIPINKDRLGNVEITAVGSPNVSATVEVRPMSKRFISVPATLRRGDTSGSVPHINPGTEAVTIIGPSGTSVPLAGVDDTNREKTATVDGVTYTRTRALTLITGVYSSYLEIRVSATATLGEHKLRFDSGPPELEHKLTILPAAIVTPSRPEPSDPTAPTIPVENQARLNCTDTDLPDPANFEVPTDPRSYHVPAGEVRIDEDGIAWKKVGRANFGDAASFSHWERLNGGGDVQQHPYIFRKSVAQVNVGPNADGMAAAERDARVGATVRDIRGNVWIYGHFLERDATKFYWGCAPSLR